MPEKLRRFIDRRTTEGSFGTPTEYVRHLIRQDEQRQAEERLEVKLLEGLDSDLSDESLTDFLGRLRRRIRTARKKQ